MQMSINRLTDTQIGKCGDTNAILLQKEISMHATMWNKLKILCYVKEA